MTQAITLTKQGPYAILTFNRPEAYNAMDWNLADDLVNYSISLGRDKSVKGIVLTGNGKAFSAGGDLKWMLDFAEGPGNAVSRLAAHAHKAILEIRRMPKPVVAAINGVAAGVGLSTALACDFRIMAKSAKLKQAYPSAGLSMDGGQSFLLPRLVGLARSLEISAFDAPIASEQALSWGLVTKVVEDETTLEEAVKLLESIKTSPHSFAQAKRLLLDSWNTPMEAQLEREREAITACIEHPEGQEGVKAFTEKRAPKFS